jgi:hypothetical protein
MSVLIAIIGEDKNDQAYNLAWKKGVVAINVNNVPINRLPGITNSKKIITV